MISTGHYTAETIEQQLKTYIAENLAYEQTDLVLTKDFNLIDQRIIDSLGILRLKNFIEESFTVELAPDDLILSNFNTIEHITALILSKME